MRTRQKSTSAAAACARLGALFDDIGKPCQRGGAIVRRIGELRFDPDAERRFIEVTDGLADQFQAGRDELVANLDALVGGLADLEAKLKEHAG